jgi:hypothetical protein
MFKQYTLQEWIIAIAMNNEGFRQQLLDDPKDALAHELGLSLPQDVNLQVHEQTPTTIHLVLPARVQEGERVEMS